MKMRWIDTTKRRPKQGTMVLFYAPWYCEVPCYGYYRDGEWYDQGLDYTTEEKKRVEWPVTHWMLIPGFPAHL